MSNQSKPGYRSFLIRLWPNIGGEQMGWQGELELIQEGRLFSFDSLQELTDFLYWQAQPLELDLLRRQRRGWRRMP